MPATMAFDNFQFTKVNGQPPSEILKEKSFQ
jgi:hypothetical protein